MLLLALIAGGLSLFLRSHWLEASELLGAPRDGSGCSATRGADLEDRRVGCEVAQKREAVVETSSASAEEVAPPPPVRTDSPSSRLEKSVRVEKERQDHPSPLNRCGGALPPLALLDEPAHDVEPPSAET